jgi:3-hydroxyacyl-CoA dehydrogenase/enoyl-CoA hydratase/3-hydroxybutyryl-CoA epimerase
MADIDTDTGRGYALRVELGADGVAVATMDAPGRTMNVLDDALAEPLAALVERLAGDAAIRGLVLATGKPDFLAGADVARLAALATAQEAFDESMRFKAVLRRLERAGKPVVAAIRGKCLGAGLELALACHRRIVLDDGRARLGLPEVRLGLLPGGGGTQRLPRLVGMQQALPWMLEGTEVTAAQALSAGLVDALAADADELLAQARAWILANPAPRQPWDQPAFRYPGGDSRSPAAAQLFSIAPSMASARSHGRYPALTHILSCVFEGGLMGIDQALELESRFFAACAMSQESRNLIGTLWFQRKAIERGASRPADAPPSTVRRLGVLGAGMMGAGIACAAARADIDVVLLDASPDNAVRGRLQAQELMDAAVRRGEATPERRDAVLARITPTVRFDDLAGCDLVIEAVFEDRAVKADVTRQAEAWLAEDAVFASNTSTLPITGLAQASLRPANFIGLHFFSPVHRMPLVEIVVGAATSPATLARGFDFVRQIGKTPIVVNDARGFYTSRVFATYVMEGLAMLREGVHPRRIEAAGLAAGMPMPPLALQDEVSLTLALHVADQARRDFAAEGRAYVEHPGEAVLRQMCEIGRIGRKASLGFYDWTDAGRRLWPGLARMFPVAARQPPERDLLDRLMFVQANEAARCVEEGVLRSVADANVGSILGWGFAPFHGGALQFVNAMGARRFVERARELAAAHGPRFEPARVIVHLAERDGVFED